MAWSVKFLPPNPTARVRFPAGPGIIISILGLDVWLCVLSCVVSGSGPDILLTIDRPYIRESSTQ